MDYIPALRAPRLILAERLSVFCLLRCGRRYDDVAPAQPLPATTLINILEGGGHQSNIVSPFRRLERRQVLTPRGSFFFFYARRVLQKIS